MSEDKSKETERDTQPGAGPQQAPGGDMPSPGAEASDAEGAGDSQPTAEESLQAAREEIEELRDQLLRKIAEFDNYRKRTIKEKTDLILNGGEKVIVSVLPVIDDMERALKTARQGGGAEAVAEGVELIHKKFLDILSRQGVTVIEAAGADFDTDVHEAIAQLPAPSDEMKGKVMDCALTGYKLNEKVIRHAQVVVGL